MANVYLDLDTRRVKRDGTFPIKVVVIHKRKPLRLSTGYSIVAKDWNSSRSYIKASSKAFPNVTRVNKILESKKDKVLSILTKLEDEDILHRLSIQELKGRLTREQTTLHVLSFCRQIMTRLQERKRIGNAAVYKTLHNSIARYVGNENLKSLTKDIPFTHITVVWLEQYATWYLRKGNSINGLSVHLRTFRALYNKAIIESPSLREYYPFGNGGYTISHEKTKKRAISKSDLLKIIEFVPQTKRQERARDYFLMSFFLMGASFIDLAYLRIKDVKEGRITYKRRKTQKVYNIKIVEPLQRLLDKYANGKSADDFILSVIKSEEIEQQYTNVRDELRRYNRSIKEIAQLCGITSSLSSYTSRHSYATISKHLGVPVSVISEALGHETEKTTQIYLDSFETEVMDKYHDKVAALGMG